MTQKRSQTNKAITTIIIDDERPARELIATLLSEYDDFVVVGECADGREAVAAIGRSKPDLIFLDIRMPYLDGFGVLERLDLDAPPIIIFVTAYDQYAVRAFEVNALDYLLKPIRRQRFAEAIVRARQLLKTSGESQAARLRNLLQHWDRSGVKRDALSRSVFLQRIFVRERRKSISIEVADIDWIGSLDHFVEIHASGRSHVLHDKLSAVEEKLNPEHFFRIHRTRIVNLAAIKRFAIDSTGNYITLMRDGTSHRVARTRCSALRDLLNR